MLIWNIIRDWFVQNIFGGILTDGTTVRGLIYGLKSSGEALLYNDNIYFSVGLTAEGNPLLISVGDWLSTTATLIVLIAICFALFFLVRYFFRMFAGLLSGR